MSNTTYTATEINSREVVFSADHVRISKTVEVTKTTSRSVKTHTVIVSKDTNENAGWRAVANYNPEGNQVWAKQFDGFQVAALALFA